MSHHKQSLGRLVFAVCSPLFSLAPLACHKAESSSAPTASAAPLASVQAPAASSEAPDTPLRIAYSDWPGWVAWEIALKKGYFKDAGVAVSFVWLEYVPSIEAFSEGKVDAVSMTNGDALVAGSSDSSSVGILINDYSNGNDMVVARPGINTIADLKGKRIGVEVGFVDHLLLMEALKSAKLGEADVSIINAKTEQTPALLKSGGVDAIAAWQPNSGRALDDVPGAKPIFTSANVPGLIYDLLFVNKKSLGSRRADWEKVTKVWFRVVDFISDPAHHAEAAQIMGARVGLSADKYGKLMSGTRLLGADENQKRYHRSSDLSSVQGSSEIVDRFNVANHVYKESLSVDAYFDGTLVDAALSADKK
ncbi:MAG TPA: ABC transporter substrate-binding protein [Polyangiaceae bacterium]|jgi:NitT/TauT family transport system substrate-binding protein|nr:ABC transporter substrate-binding protein [Polyangiaceae bacterium]